MEPLIQQIIVGKKHIHIHTYFKNGTWLSVDSFTSVFTTTNLQRLQLQRKQHSESVPPSLRRWRRHVRKNDSETRDLTVSMRLPVRTETTTVKAVPYASGLEHADTKLVGTMKDLQLHCWLPQRLESSKHQSSGVYKLVGGNVSNSKTTSLISWSSSFLLVVVSKYHSTTH